MDDAALDALRRHRFPGGTRGVEHWENWLLTDCTRRAQLRDGLLHPVVLFHLPLAAAGTSVGELLALGGGGAPGSVTLLGYDWEYLVPLREGVPYRGSGGVATAERHRDAEGVLYDDVSFRIELHTADGALAARVTNHWRFRRSTAPSATLEPVAGTGAPLPEWRVDGVGVDRMKTMAALLRDPYPIHWDPAAVQAAGHGDRPVNQGPLNLAYVANMLMAWAGDDAVRRLTVAFHGRVFAGDDVVAGGTADATHEGRTRCTVWLDRGGQRLLSGTAEVQAPG